MHKDRLLKIKVKSKVYSRRINYKRRKIANYQTTNWKSKHVSMETAWLFKAILRYSRKKLKFKILKICHSKWVKINLNKQINLLIKEIFLLNLALTILEAKKRKTKTRLGKIEHLAHQINTNRTLLKIGLLKIKMS